MPRKKTECGDSAGVIMAAELIQSEIEKTNKRYRSADLQDIFSISHSKCFNSIKRLKRQGILASAKCGIETFYFLVANSDKHISELEKISSERKALAAERNRERQRKIDQARTEKARQERSAGKVSGLSAKLVVTAVRENSKTRVGKMTFLKYGEG